MIRKVLLAAALSLLSGGAFAACTNPLSIKDGSAASISMSMSSNGDGFCQYNFNLAQIGGSAVVTGTGVSGSGIPRVTVSSDSSHPVTVVSGGIASGGIASGAMVDLGAQADAACGTATGTCSLIALQKFNNATSPVLAAGSASIGAVGSDPSLGKATPTSTFLALPATTTTQIVALSGSKVTYVTSYRFMAGGTVNVTFKYGTGSNCGTGTTTLEGPWPLTAQAGMTAGSGLGAIMIVPSAQALCVTTDASTTGGVALSYQQF